jgi:thiol-activated cytolysin
MGKDEVAQYIAGLTYEPKQLLSIVDDGLTSTLPVKTRGQEPNGIILCTKTTHTLKKNLSDVSILSNTAGVIFPGALVLADENLKDGRPTPIALPRRAAQLSVDLPGLQNPNMTVNPDNASVQQALNKMLEDWNKQGAPAGYKNAARSFLNVSQSFTKEQLSLDLGFSAKWASGSASAQLGVASTTEKSVVVAYYKQVYYTVTMNTPTLPADVFDDSVTQAQAQPVFGAAHPPAYVRSVDYGRLLVVKMETSAVDTSFNLKGAFEQATAGGVTLDANLAAKYQKILNDASFTVLALGGGAETPLKTFTGGAEVKFTGLKEYIETDGVYRRDNPGVPISYQVAFLKDNQFALMGFTTDYVETVCVRYPTAWIGLWNDAGYVAWFRLRWTEPDAQGLYNQEKMVEFTGTTAGWNHQVDLPGDAQGIRIEAWAATFIAVWADIFSVHLDGPNNTWYRAYGTTGYRYWDNNKPG